MALLFQFEFLSAKGVPKGGIGPPGPLYPGNVAEVLPTSSTGGTMLTREAADASFSVSLRRPVSKTNYMEAPSLSR